MGDTFYRGDDTPVTPLPFYTDAEILADEPRAVRITIRVLRVVLWPVVHVLKRRRSHA